jgi:hypothetical protein
MSDDWFDLYKDEPLKATRKYDTESSLPVIEVSHSESERKIMFLFVVGALPGYQNSLYFSYGEGKVFNTAAVKRPVLAKVEPPPLRSFLNELLDVQSLEVQVFGVKLVSVQYGISQNFDNVKDSFERICKKTLGIDSSVSLQMFPG